jgi:nucleotide-binding universal stress UspA family protein
VRALDIAIDLAARYAEPLILVYGVSPPGGRGEEFAEHERALAEIGRDVGLRAAHKAQAAGVEVHVELVHAKPAQALLDVADARNARMIVVGSYGEGPVRGAMLGSTPYRLVWLSQRPVLVVPQPHDG